MFRSKLRQGTILCWIGTMGSGKTLSMAREAQKYHRLGLTVYSNFKLNFPFVWVSKELLKKMLRGEFELENAVLCLDEVHQVIDSRRGQSLKSVLFSYMVNQSRKKSVRILLTTQFFGQIDTRARQSTSIVVKCKSFEIGEKTIVIQTLFRPCSAEEFVAFKMKLFVANPFFGLYDSSEAIYLGDLDVKDEKKPRKTVEEKEKDDTLKNLQHEEKILRVNSKIRELQEKINKKFGYLVNNPSNS